MSLLQARSAALLTPDSLRGDTAEKFLTGMQNAALNAALSAGATEVQGRLPFIRALSVRYESAYAGRDDLAELNLMLSLLERDRGALYLQANALAQEGRLGSNLGLGYRLDLVEGLQVGANFFYDWLEQPDLQRTSVGLEARTPLLDISANLYDALGSDDLSEDGKIVTHGLDGWDLQLQGRLPWLTWLAAEARYYSWNQRFGEADLEGQEYRLLFTPFRLLEFRVNYDDPENTPTDWGASLALHYDFGLSLKEHLRKGSLTSSFSENLELRRFEPVRRQVRQRHQEVAVVTEVFCESDAPNIQGDGDPAYTSMDGSMVTSTDSRYPLMTIATYPTSASGFTCDGSTTYTCTLESGGTSAVWVPDSGTPRTCSPVVCDNAAPNISDNGDPGYTLNGNTVTATNPPFFVSTIATYPTSASGFTCDGSTTYTCTLESGGTSAVWVPDSGTPRTCSPVVCDNAAPDISDNGDPGYTLNGNTVTATNPPFFVSTIATYPTPASGFTCDGSTTYTCTLESGGTSAVWVPDSGTPRTCSPVVCDNAAPDISDNGDPGYTLNGNTVTATNPPFFVSTIATYPTPASGFTCDGSTTYTCTLESGGTSAVWVPDSGTPRTCSPVVCDNAAPDISDNGDPGYTLNGNTVTATNPPFFVSTIATYPTPASGFTCDGSTTYTCTLESGGTSAVWVPDSGTPRTCSPVVCDNAAPDISDNGDPDYTLNGNTVTATNPPFFVSTIATYPTPASGFTCDGSTTYTCTLESGGTSAVWVPDSGTPRTCSPVVCDNAAPDISDNGDPDYTLNGNTVTATNPPFFVSTIATYPTPASGFTCDGSTTYTCTLESGGTSAVWVPDSGTPRTCSATGCLVADLPEPPANTTGTVSYYTTSGRATAATPLSEGRYPLGTNATIDCTFSGEANTDYSISVCQTLSGMVSWGLWDGGSPVCPTTN